MAGLNRENWRRAVWGVVLIVVGMVFLLVQMDLLRLGKVWKLWPAIMILMGFVWMVAPQNLKQIASGVSMILWGVWLFACTYHWFGLTYWNAWPLLLVIFGGEMILAAALERFAPRPGDKEEHHA